MSTRTCDPAKLVVIDYTTKPGSLRVSESGDALVPTNQSGATGAGNGTGDLLTRGADSVDTVSIPAPRPDNAPSLRPAEA